MSVLHYWGDSSLLKAITMQWLGQTQQHILLYLSISWKESKICVCLCLYVCVCVWVCVCVYRYMLKSVRHSLPDISVCLWKPSRPCYCWLKQQGQAECLPPAWQICQPRGKTERHRERKGKIPKRFHLSGELSSSGSVRRDTYHKLYNSRKQ